MADPTLNLTVAGPAAGRYCSERGYYRYDPMPDAFGDAFVTNWQATGWFTGSPPPAEAYSPSCVYVEPLQAVMPRPYWNFISIPFWNNWTYYPVTATIEDIEPGGALLTSNLYHFAVSNLTEAQGAKSSFVLPADPAFMIHLRRHDLPWDWDWTTYEPVTIIYFGQYSLHIPYRRRARLGYRFWQSDPTILDEFDLNINLARDAAGEETVDLTIICTKGGVLFSADYMATSHFYQPSPDPDDWIAVSPYYLVVENVGGRFSFAFVPIDAPAKGIFLARDEAMGYAPVAGHPVAAGPIQSDRLYPLYNQRLPYDGYTIPRRRRNDSFGSITVDYPLGMADDHCAYRVTITPNRVRTTSGFFLGRFPLLFATRLMAAPACDTRAGGAASTIAETDVTDLSVDLSDDFGVDSATITLHNEDQPTIRTGVTGYDNIQEYEQIAIELQGPAETSATTVMAGYVLRVGASLAADDKDAVRLELGSPWILFRDYRCLETDPCLSGWYSEDAIEWYVNACGLPVAFTKHAGYNSKGRQLPLGLGGDRGWQSKPGTSAADVLEAIALWEDYQLYFDGWTLKYEPYPLDTQAVDWILYASDADKPNLGGKPELLMLESAEAVRDPEDHRNEVIVIGQDRATGDYLVAQNVDNTQIGASATQVGHRKMLMIVDSQYDGAGVVQRVARKLYDRYSKWPPRRLAARVLGRAAIKRKQAVKVYGAGLRSHLGVFRIETVQHHFTGRHLMTELEAVWIRDG